MSKQIRDVDIGTFKKVVNTIYEYCPGDFGLGEKTVCNNNECFDCWLVALDKDSDKKDD